MFHPLLDFFSPAVEQIPKSHIVYLLALQIEIVLLPLPPFLASHLYAFHQLNLL